MTIFEIVTAIITAFVVWKFYSFYWNRKERAEALKSFANNTNNTSDDYKQLYNETKKPLYFKTNGIITGTPVPLEDDKYSFKFDIVNISDKTIIGIKFKYDVFALFHKKILSSIETVLPAAMVSYEENTCNFNINGISRFGIKYDIAYIKMKYIEVQLNDGTIWKGKL